MRSYVFGLVFGAQLAQCYEDAKDVMLGGEGELYDRYDAWGASDSGTSQDSQASWYDGIDNIVVLDPSMNAKTLQAKIWQIQNATSHFGTERYAILLKPGVYPQNLWINPGYYMSIIGVGPNAEDVQIPDIWVSNDVTGHATNNFWRSLEGVTVTGPRTSWAVSQAAPLRRSVITGELWLSHKEGYSSGGFISDVKIEKLVMGTQQQWFFRQASVGAGGLRCWQGWNYVFMGVDGLTEDTVQKCNQGVPLRVAQMDQTARSAEKPYLVMQEEEWMMMVPSIRHQPAPGYIKDRDAFIARRLRLSEVFVATPSMRTETILEGMQRKEALLLTPGIYRLTEPLEITKSHFVVLGIGFPTLVSPPGQSCVKVQDGLEDVRVASIIMDANTPLSQSYTEPLLKWGSSRAPPGTMAGVATDIVARVGAFAYLDCELKRADTMLEFNADDTIIDNVWVWHADHDDCSDFVMGKGLDMMDHHFKSDECQSKHGIVVNGKNVVAYGVFVEHIEGGHMLKWNGEAGQLYFFQAELPYHSDIRLEKRYAAYAVAENVYSHFALGLGAYIIGGKPAYMAYQTSEFADLRSVITVAINAPDSTFHHQVCQVSLDGGSHCFPPQNCSWSRCWRGSVPRADAGAMQLHGAFWPHIPPTEKLPMPQIVKTLQPEDQWNADFSVRDTRGASRQAAKELADSETFRRKLWNLTSKMPWLSLAAFLTLLIALSFRCEASPSACSRDDAEAERMLGGHGPDLEWREVRVTSI